MGNHDLTDEWYLLNHNEYNYNIKLQLPEAKCLLSEKEINRGYISNNRNLFSQDTSGPKQGWVEWAFPLNYEDQTLSTFSSGALQVLHNIVTAVCSIFYRYHHPSRGNYTLTHSQIYIALRIYCQHDL
jgi:hypothetical protein